MSVPAEAMRLGRQGVAGARSPFPLQEQLPSMLMDDPMISAFVSALDEVWAPVVSTIDCFDAYLDPNLAPPDMVAYLGSWILAMTGEARDEAGLRHNVATAHLQAAWRGTARSVHERLVPGEARDVTIVDPGSTIISATPTDPQQWRDPEDPTVIVSVTASTDVTPREVQRLRRMVSDVVPAHIVVDVRVNGSVSDGIAAT